MTGRPREIMLNGGRWCHGQIRVLRMYPEHQRPRICGEKLTPPPYGKAHNDDSD